VRRRSRESLPDPSRDCILSDTDRYMPALWLPCKAGCKEDKGIMENADTSETALRLNAVEGLLDLGAAKDALVELQAFAPSGCADEKRATSLRVTASAMLEGPHATATSAMIAVQRGVANGLTMEIAINEAIIVNQFTRAAEMARTYLKQFDAKNAHVWQNLACAETQLAKYESALFSVVNGLTHLSADPVWPLLDAHLAPMWHHFGEGKFSQRAAECLLNPVFSRLLSDLKNERGLRPVCWHTAHLLMPKAVVPHLQRQRFLPLFLPYSAPAHIRRCFLCWLDNRRHRMERVLRKALQHASRIAKSQR
jgi:hypothetical protein